MKRVIIIFLVLCFQVGLRPDIYAQNDTLIAVLKEAFYNKKIYDNVFFDYKGLGEPPQVLPKGRYVLIRPDTVFQKVYPDVLADLAASWGTERKLFAVTLIHNDSLGDVLVKTKFSDINIERFVIFKKIWIKDKEASLSFLTTSFSEKEKKQKHYRIECDLRCNSGKWEITRLKVRKRPL